MTEAFAAALAGTLDPRRRPMEGSPRRLHRAQGQRAYRDALRASRCGRAGRRHDAVRRRSRSSPPRAARQRLSADVERYGAAVLPEARVSSRSAATRCRVGDEWLANTTMEKRLAADDREQAVMTPRTPLSLRHHLARRRADDRASISRSRTSAPSPRCSTSSASITWRAAIRARTRSTPTFFAEKRTRSREIHRLRHDQAGRALRLERSRHRRLLEAQADAICFVAKAWDYHVRVALETTLEENLAGIRESVAAARDKGREVLVDCEHFFDGYKANPDYALACARTAYDAGARWVVLCDTNGGTLPHEVGAIVVATSTADRAGRASRHPCPRRLRLRGRQLACRRRGGRAPHPGHAQRPRRALRQRQSRDADRGAEAQGRICGALRSRRVSDEALEPAHARVAAGRRNPEPPRRTATRRSSARAPSRRRPASTPPPCLKDPRTYEHVEPEIVGNVRRVLVSDQGGRSNMLVGTEAPRLRPRKGRPARIGACSTR